VEAYHANIYKPVEGTSLSAPIIVERVAISACNRRLDLDLQTPDAAVLFGNVPLMAGRLADVESQAVADTIQRLFRVILQREPSADDTAALRELYRDIEGSAEARVPARDWAVLSCMALMTSTEFLFY
jgi:hypothetical protein